MGEYMTQPDHWTQQAHRNALMGMDVQANYDQPHRKCGLDPDHFRDDTPEHALARRAKDLEGEDLRHVEEVLIDVRRLQKEVDHLLELHGYPVDPTQIDVWDDDEEADWRWSKYNNPFRNRDKE